MHDARVSVRFAHHFDELTTARIERTAVIVYLACLVAVALAFPYI